MKALLKYANMQINMKVNRNNSEVMMPEGEEELLCEISCRKRESRRKVVNTMRELSNA